MPRHTHPRTSRARSRREQYLSDSDDERSRSRSPTRNDNRNACEGSQPCSQSTQVETSAEAQENGQVSSSVPDQNKSTACKDNWNIPENTGEFGWQSDMSVLDANQQMLSLEIATDVAFLVGEVPNQKLIRAHKYVLASRSPVFFAMLCGGLRVRDTEAPVEIPDATPDAFNALLRYMYSEGIDLTPENVIRLAYLSDKYLVNRLKQRCIDFFKRQVLTAANALDFMEFKEYQIPEIYDAILTMIRTYPKAILAKDHKKVTRDILRQVLATDFLNCSELEAFMICYNWARNVCHDSQLPFVKDMIVNELGDVLNLVRYPVMEPADFAKVSTTKLLDPEVRCMVFEYIHRGKDWEDGKEKAANNLPFSTDHRANYNYRSDPKVMEVYFGGRIAAYPNEPPVSECTKGCLLCNIHAPPDGLPPNSSGTHAVVGFRFQLNELICPSYRQTPVKVKVTIRRIRSGLVGPTCYTDSIEIRPKESEVNRCRYHEASLRSAVQLPIGGQIEILIECDHALYYHPAREPVAVWPLKYMGLALDVTATRAICADRGAVGDLIHGIKYMGIARRNGQRCVRDN